MSPLRVSPFSFVVRPHAPMPHKKVIEMLLEPLTHASEYSDWDLCLAHFLRSIHDKSHSFDSLYSYSYNLYRFFSREPTKHPENYTSSDIDDYIHTPTQKKPPGPPSVSTMNNRRVALASFYRYAATYTISGEDGSPVPLLRTPSPLLNIHAGKATRHHLALSADEVQRFFAVIPKDSVLGLRDRAIFLFFFWTARRRSEVARLCWRDIERAVIVDEHGNRAQGWVYHFVGKGKAGERDSAELPLPAKEALDAYLIKAGRMDIMQPETPLFVSRNWGGARLNRDAMSSHAMYQCFKKYCKKAGLDPQRFSLHSWRHTSVQQRYAAGSDIREIQKLLRHASLQTTDVYLRVLMGTSDPGAHLLEKRFRDL